MHWMKFLLLKVNTITEIKQDVNVTASILEEQSVTMDDLSGQVQRIAAVADDVRLL